MTNGDWLSRMVRQKSMVLVSVQWFVFGLGLEARCCMSLYVSAWLFIRVQIWCSFPGVSRGRLCGVRGVEIGVLVGLDRVGAVEDFVG